MGLLESGAIFFFFFWPWTDYNIVEKWNFPCTLGTTAVQLLEESELLLLF